MDLRNINGKKEKNYTTNPQPIVLWYIYVRMRIPARLAR